jgi:hypothetical protein
MNIEYKDTVKEARATSLKGVSNLVIERLSQDPAFRKSFQEDPVAALKDCGCPEVILPDRQSVSGIDFITLGRKLERIQLYTGDSAIAVACVVI